MTCPLCTGLAVGHGKARQMTVAGRNAIAMIDLKHAAVAVVEIGVGDDAVGGSQHRLAVVAGNVDAGVEGAFTVERIDTLAECTRNRAHHRPHGRSSRGIRPSVNVALWVKPKPRAAVAAPDKAEVRNA